MDTDALLVLVGASADIPLNVVCGKHNDVMFTTHCVCFAILCVIYIRMSHTACVLGIG
jgi:hypothetical protein